VPLKPHFLLLISPFHFHPKQLARLHDSLRDSSQTRSATSICDFEVSSGCNEGRHFVITPHHTDAGELGDPFLEDLRKVNPVLVELLKHLPVSNADAGR